MKTRVCNKSRGSLKEVARSGLVKLLTIAYTDVHKKRAAKIGALIARLTIGLYLKEIWKGSFLVLIILSCQSCNDLPERVNEALEEAGKNRSELEKAINHYQENGDRQKLKALFYLLGNMAGQYHYEGDMVQAYNDAFVKMDSVISTEMALDYTETWKTLQPANRRRLRKVYDIRVVSSAFLIENIERSFAAWEYPWARHLSFEDFCRYILPYKVKNEKPENWKTYFQQRYAWIPDSLQSGATCFDACVLINQEMSQWFYITKLNCPFDLSFSQINKIKSGRCSESTQMTAYAMRAMGIPVTLEHVPAWANRNSGHDWNGLVMNGRTIPFLGTEIDPGVYKVEFPMPGSLRSKRAKVYRRTFESNESSLAFNTKDLERIPGLFRDAKLEDVTSRYVPVADVKLKVKEDHMAFKTAYLCVFNTLQWVPVYYGSMESKEVIFRDMGKGIVYLPAVYDDGAMIPIDAPFLLDENGSIIPITADNSTNRTITLSRKYPSGDSNKIQPGTEYELFYWDNQWSSLGVQSSQSDSITYSNVPENALLWIHKVNKGIEERIFTYANGHPTWR